MPPALTFSGAFTQWTADWPALVAGVLLAVAYVRGARRTTWPLRRTIAFLAGVAVLLFSICSFLGVYDDVLFWTRALQNILLLMGVPLLFAMGSPLRLIMLTARPKTAQALRVIGRSAPARALTLPLTVTVLILLPLPLLYLSGLYEATLRHESASLIFGIVLLVCGFLYYWTRLGIDPTPRNTAHVVSFAISFAETLVDGALGIIVWLGPLIAHGYYLGLHRTWDPSMRQDQTMGAVALWFGGDAIGIPYLIVLFVQWIRDESRKSKSIDAMLDQQESEPEDGDMQPGLWWESNPELSRRYGLRERDE